MTLTCLLAAATGNFAQAGPQAETGGVRPVAPVQMSLNFPLTLNLNSPRPPAPPTRLELALQTAADKASQQGLPTLPPSIMEAATIAQGLQRFNDQERLLHEQIAATTNKEAISQQSERTARKAQINMLAAQLSSLKSFRDLVRSAAQAEQDKTLANALHAEAVELDLRIERKTRERVKFKWDHELLWHDNSILTLPMDIARLLASYDLARHTGGRHDAAPLKRERKILRAALKDAERRGALAHAREYKEQIEALDKALADVWYPPGF